MRKISRLSILATGLFFIMSCGRQINCSDFNNEVLDWIPYQNNDTVRLINPPNDSTIILVVNEIVIDHTTHYMTNVDCGTCDDHIMVNGNEPSKNDFQIEIRLNDNNINVQSFLIKGFNFSKGNSEYSEKADYLFEGHKYDVVRIFEKKSAIEGFNKLILAKGVGIIGLVDYKGNNWTLKVSASKSLKSEPIEIKNISCG